MRIEIFYLLPFLVAFSVDALADKMIDAKERLDKMTSYIAGEQADRETFLKKRRVIYMI